MPIPKNLSKSPFEINKPEDRWKPDIDRVKEPIQQYNAPFVEKIRKEVYEWRQFGYDGASLTSRSLLNFWFNYQHKNNFQYYFAQRESVESIIYLFENKKIRSNKELLPLDSWGITEDFLQDDWLRLIIKQATGSGKTKVLSLLMAWSYFNNLYEKDSLLTKNFLLIAPNTIVLDRLRNDIEGLKIFQTDPLVPYSGYEGKSWDFAPRVHIQDEIKSISDSGNIFLTNIQRFADRSKHNNEYDLKDKFLGLVPESQNLNGSQVTVKEISKNIDNIIVLNDEAHHVYENTAWKRSIEDIHNSLKQKGKRLVLQIDVTATPKNKKGEIFTQTIADYPLVEAIYQEVVKKPVIPNLPSRQRLKEYPSAIFSEKYRDYLHLGYETWKEQYEKHKKMNKKALLFIMVDDTKNCDDVERYLNSTFPFLKNGIFVIHTKDNSKDATGEINENTAKGKEELQRLRRLVNTVDDLNSPIKVIISVLMLKEGWDVRNVTTIVGLRAYASHILPEQTLGRGLRRMYFGQNIDEELDVIGTENFIEYVKSISEEGVQLEEIAYGLDKQSSGPVVINVDDENEKKDLFELDIDIPKIPKRYGRDFLSLQTLNPYEFKFKPCKLRTYSKEDSTKIIVFKDIIEGEEQKTISFDNLEYLTSTTVLRFFTEIIVKDLGFSRIGVNHFIYEKLKIFVVNLLFGKKVNIEELNIIRNLSEPFVTSQIIEIFKKEINYLSLKDMGFKEGIDAISIADTKPYLSSRKKIYYSPKKSVFNLIAGDSKFEIEFSKYLDSFEDVIGFFKNDIQLKQYIEYVKHDGKIGLYYPDFFIKLSNGERWVVETKGAENLNDPLKYKRLETWCQDASKSQNISWNCFYLRQEQWNGLKIKPDRFLDLVNLLDN